MPSAQAQLVISPPGPPPQPTTLQSRNVIVGSQRTSMRLEPEMWDALNEIANRERLSIHDLCSRIETRRRQSSMTSAVRVFIVAYFRQAAAGETSIAVDALL